MSPLYAQVLLYWVHKNFQMLYPLVESTPLSLCTGDLHLLSLGPHIRFAIGVSKRTRTSSPMIKSHMRYHCAMDTYMLSEKTNLTQRVLLDLHVPLEGSQVYPLVPALGLEPRKTSF